MKPDLIKISNSIKGLIDLIGQECNKLYDFGTEKAKASVAYDRECAISTLKLKPDHPATLIDKLVKGECIDQLYDKMVAESMYKSCITVIEARKAQLNALQSLFKVQETI